MSASSPSGGKIRVLIVDDIPETRENIKKLLYFESDIEVSGAAGNGREGIDLAIQLQPDIVLMDINMPEMDGIAASEAISAKAPNVQVVMMSVQGEADYLRRSMLAGAREFLIKPFSGEELVTSIHRVHQFAVTRRVAVPPPPPSMPEVLPAEAPKGGRVIVIFGTKGGSGASTIAVNLAVALREETKERVALVDANFEFGDIGVLLNLPTNRTIADLVGDKNVVDEELLEGTMASHSSGIKVLLAPPRPELAELIKVGHLKKILEHLSKSYDYIVVDAWKSCQESTVFFMDTATQILLVSTTDIPAIKNAKLFLELTEKLGYPPEKSALILNKEDGRSGITAKDVEASIKHAVSSVIPRDDRTTMIASNRGVPFVTTQRALPLAQAIITLARILQRSTSEKETAGAVRATATQRK